MKQQYIIEPSFKNKNHFTIVSNFDLQLYFTPRCAQGCKNEGRIIKGVELFTTYLTRNDLKEFKEWNFNFTEITDFSEFWRN